MKQRTLQVQELMRRNGEMQRVLREIAEAAVVESSLGELYQTVHQLLLRVLPAENCNFAMLDDSGQRIVVPYCVDESGTIQRERPVGQGITEYIMRQGKAMHVTLDEWRRLQAVGEIKLYFAPVQNYLGAPLVDPQGQAFGVLSINVMGESYTFLEEDIEALSIIAAQVSLAIERKKAQEALKDSEARFRLAMEFSGIGYMDIDIQQRTMRLSPHWRKQLGLQSEGEILPWDAILANIFPEDELRRKMSLSAYLRGDKANHEVEYRFRLPDASWIWVLVRAQAIRNSAGQPIRLIGTLTDITELKLRAEQEKYNAEHDELTGLMNRQGFAVKVKNLLDGGQSGALVLIDIDEFELINDVYGHTAGDQYLIDFARLLREHCSPASIVGRFGGDEFILFFPGSDGLQQSKNAFAALKNISLDTPSGSFYVRTSWGIALCPAQGQDLSLLIQHADLALHHAKKHGKWHYKLYEPQLQETVYRRHAIREGLNNAIGHNEFHLVYQPIFDIQPDRPTVVGYEALLRWTNPILGIISPGEFIPVAENSNLILPMGQWVLEEACRFSAVLREKLGHDVVLSVNVSMRQLAQPNFVQQVEETLRKAGVHAAAFNLEVTESILMADVEQSVACLESLRNLGMDISLDDFGTGYSSFTYLAKLPISTLKIDKSLVDDLIDNGENNSLPLLESLLYMAKRLGYRVVAEGVETPEQLRLLREKGCLYGQGYLLGKPALARDLL